MRIEYLCQLDRKLTKKEIEFIKALTDAIYEVYQKNKNLSADYILGLKMIYKKLGHNFFKTYPTDFILLAKGTNASTKKRKKKGKNVNIYYQEDKFAYYVYRTVPNKTGIKVYHY